jgi:SNF2 family DNA or RNA helicase
VKFVRQLHHELGITHLLSGPKIALWAGMGLGKTAMSLSAVTELFDRFQTIGALVVAPLRVANLTWPNEVEKWDEFRWLRVANLRTKEGRQALFDSSAHIYTINWEALPWLVDNYMFGRRAEKFAFDTVIFDELTKAKNHQSKRVNAFRAYLPRVKRRWGLTGTPAPNSLLELFAQIRLLDDGKLLGPSFTDFRNNHFFATDYMERNWVPCEGTAAYLEERLANIALVLSSKDYLDVADTVVHDVEVPLPQCAKALYKELAEELIAITATGDEIVAQNAANLTNKLLQVTSGEVYEDLDPELPEPKVRPTIKVHAAKLQALTVLLKKLKPEPVLIACNFRHEQDRIHAAVPGSVRFDSAKTIAQQQQLEADWNAGKIPYLIANPASMAHGLNLQQGGRIVVWYSYTWSRELYDQLNGRLARTGQTLVPEVYRLVCPGSMDDAVLEVLRGRGENQSALMEAVAYFRKLWLLD